MKSALKNRDTRVQIIIVENGKYILLKHLAKKENITFWGLPGGGREPHETDEEAAMREALEETGLIVRLLPIKHAVEISGKGYVYNRIVTFLAHPVKGEADTGSEPEEEQDASYNYKLIGLKWQDFYDDGGLETFTKKSVEPIRKLLEETDLKRKVGGLLYEQKNDGIRFLLRCVKNKNHGFDLPLWDVEAGHYPEDIIKQKTAGKWGVRIQNTSSVGFYFKEVGNDDCRIDVFSIPLFQNKTIKADEGYVWIDACQAGKMDLSRESKRFILEFDPGNLGNK